jgi:glycine/D-amino acid oxidase-like deaminating enzyme
MFERGGPVPLTSYDAIVLGGGTMGSAAAWELGKRGLRALVLEQFGHVHGLGAHGGKTRIIRHAYAEGAEYVPLVQRADELWLDLERESRRRILVRCGGLELAAPGFTHAANARRSAEAHGLPFERLTPAEATRRWPAVRVPDDWDAFFSPQAGFLLTEPALQAMADGARQRGVEIREHEAAQAGAPTATASSSAPPPPPTAPTA